MLSTNDYGIYNTFLAYEGILFILLGVAIHGSYKKAKYEFGCKFEEFVSSTMVLLIVNLLVFIFGISILYHKIRTFLSFNFAELILLVLFSFSTAVITCYNSYVSLSYDYKTFITISVINAIGNLSLSIVFIIIFKNAKYLGRIVGTVVPSLIIALYIIRKQYRKIKPKIIKKYLLWGVKYSLPLVPHGLSQIVLSEFDRIMIYTMIGSSASGIYSFAFNIFSIINVTATSLSQVWEPWFFEQMHSQNYSEIKKKSSYYITGMCVFSVMIMLISPEMIKLLGTSEYYEAVYCVVPIIGGGFFAFLYTLPVMVEYFHSQTKYIAIGTMGAALINILLNYLGIKQFGYIAAAYTTLISYILYFAFHYCLAKIIQKKNIFSNSVIIIVSVSILLCIFLSVSFVEKPLIRWVIAILILFLMVFIEERNIGLLKRRIKLWMNCH